MFDGNGQCEINTSKIKRSKREVKALLYPMILNKALLYPTFLNKALLYPMFLNKTLLYPMLLNKALLYPMSLKFRTSIMEGFQASLFCLSGNSNMYMKMIREHWWNNTDGGKLQYWGKKSIPVPLYPPQIRYRLA
jgi:hypothetical protein